MFDDGKPRPLPDGRLAYFASTTLAVPGRYTLTATVEYQAWDWISENVNAPATKWVNRTILNVEPSVAVVREASSRHSARRPACYTQSGTRDARFDGSTGTWHRPNEAPETDRHWTDAGPLVDDWGYEFVPDFCGLNHISPEAAISCLSRKTIHIYGDSMWRRALKSLTSAGEFCLDPTSHCACNDWSYQQILGRLYPGSSPTGD